MKMRWMAICAALAVSASAARAHVGSPDVYAQGQAGPYRLSIVIRPPVVIPGVAEVEVRAETAGIDRITDTPIPLTGEAAKHPPVPDVMERPTKDTQFFTGHLWIMETGSWQIRLVVTGSQGEGVLSIPLPATAMATRKMQTGMGVMLSALGIVLVLGMVGIVGAATREAKLAAGDAALPANRRRAGLAMTITFAVLVAGVILGNVWWKSEAASYSQYVYRPLNMAPAIEAGNLLDMKLSDPGWISERRLDDFVPDHNHIMHLYMIRWPEMDVVYHLHPEPVATGEFQLPLPSMPAGTYRLYADVVHAMGFPETIVGTVTVPAIQGRALAGDDAEGEAKPVEGSADEGGKEQRFRLADGYTMIWKEPNALTPKTPESFQFELVDAQGKPPTDMALYMGMLGHAAFVKTDGTVFAHIHPTGTVSMAAFMMANPQANMSAIVNEGRVPETKMEGAAKMPGMEMGAQALPNTVSFPYGFPTAGHYRIVVQMKHGATVETGIFDAEVGTGGA
jgi:hypothetical protein